MRIITCLLLASIFFFGCKKNDTPATQSTSSEDASSPNQRLCATDEMVQLAIKSDPFLEQRMQQLEQFTNKYIRVRQGQLNAPGVTITIPVVVHVLYNTAEENISDAQIQSQIDVLNEDFTLRNSDRSLIPRLFSNVAGDIGVHFILKQTIRTFSNKKSWPANDAMKYTQKGGSDGVDPANNLNIWVCNLQKYLGYSYYPGIRPELDGVVVLYKAFGRTGTLAVPYNLGRTATHEIGHYLNLRHIWGDATCGTDLVDDTPQHTTANFGCPAFPHYNSCGNNAVEMTMNYMDYTDDACMFMFSNGQKSRMLAVVDASGPRATLPQ
ncbi:MAG TPA: zinc metalloprotease, partial [Flavitalea sp.]|nr:zinc metalloprotease [Flavitalea sp.]